MKIPKEAPKRYVHVKRVRDANNAEQYVFLEYPSAEQENHSQWRPPEVPRERNFRMSITLSDPLVCSSIQAETARFSLSRGMPRIGETSRIASDPGSSLLGESPGSDHVGTAKRHRKGRRVSMPVQSSSRVITVGERMQRGLALIDHDPAPFPRRCTGGT